MLRADVVKGKDAKVQITMQGCRNETETALNVCIQKCLDRTGLKTHQVTILSCQHFSPPSLC